METNGNRNSLFRPKSLDRISSPEELSDYVRVANPGVWVVLSGIVVLLIGMLVWSVLGVLETNVNGVFVSQDGQALCYVSEENYNLIRTGMTVTLADGTECVVTGSESEVVPAEDVLSEYQMHLADFRIGEWVHAFQIDADISDSSEGAFQAAKVTVDSVHPMEFILS